LFILHHNPLLRRIESKQISPFRMVYLTRAGLCRVLMHLVQALIFWPSGKVIDCRLGCCLRLVVGLNLVARRRTRLHTTIPFLSQSWQTLDIESFNHLIV